MDINRTSQSTEFRAAETKQLFDWMQAGVSASVVGVSGTGKSNFFNHLCDISAQEKYLGEEAKNIICIRVNFHYAPDFSDRTIYSLILEQLELLDNGGDEWGLSPEIVQQISEQHERLLDAGTDVLKVQHHFKRALRPFFSSSQRKLIILMDQFDELYQEAESRIFANLRGLREAYKHRVVYVPLTRDLLPNMVEMDSAREEFYELMSVNVLGLSPYRPDDAHRLLQRIATRHHLPLGASFAERLIYLCGGHAGLLRASYLTIARHETVCPDEDQKAILALIKVHGVKLECEKLWQSLSVHERQLLVDLSTDTAFDKNGEFAEQTLQLKGILSETDPVSIFSPLFAQYAHSQEAEWERPFYFDEATRQVWVLGKLKPILSHIEFRLLQALYHRPREVVTKDELVYAGWPNAKGGVTNEALHALISRLRKKIEPEDANYHFLETVRGQGYKLNIKNGE